MKPLFSIHEGEFLVGDYITRNMSKNTDRDYTDYLDN